MLRQASVEIAKGSALFTAVARTSESLRALAHAIGDEPGREQSYVTLDWDQPDPFLHGLSQLARLDPPSLVVAWLHDMKLGPRVAHALSKQGSRCEFFQIMGSAAGSPHGDAAAVRNLVESPSDLIYHQVILGFKREACSSRWLTDEEISQGVLDAISTKQPSYVVGTVTPWGERP